MTRRLLVLVLLLSPPGVRAQGIITGRVTDAETGEPVAGAAVVRWRAGQAAAYDFAAADGVYRLSDGRSDSLTAAAIGYARQRVERVTGTVDFALQPEPLQLREVEIVGRRLSGEQDTLSYYIKQFATDRDHSLKEVLKRLPGIEVDDKGQISYNGRPIDRFTVEGLDLSGGRYNLLSENLKAADVARAEIIGNYQPVRALRNQVRSDRVALNVRLKEQARNRWAWTLAAGGGYTADSPHLLWSGRASALQIGRQQHLYLYEADNTGLDLSASARQLTAGDGERLFAAGRMPAWLALPGLQAPAGERRVRRNHSHRASLNHLHKTSEQRTVRLTADWLHDGFEQAAEEVSLYYPDLRLSEVRLTRRRDDTWRGAWSVETNGEEVFRQNGLTLTGSRQRAWNDLQSDLRKVGQLVERSSVGAEASRHTVRRRGGHTRRYDGSLQVGWMGEKLHLDSSVADSSHSWGYTDHTLTWMRRYGFLTQYYRVGAAAEGLWMEGSHGRFTAALAPRWEYARGVWWLRLSVPACYRVQPGLSRLMLTPSLRVNLRAGYRSEWALWASRSESPGDWTETWPHDWQSDYRTFHAAARSVPLRRDLTAGVSYTYKNPLAELFGSGGIQGSRSRCNVLSDLTIEGDRCLCSTLDTPSVQRAVSVWSKWSKGIYSWHLKVKAGFLSTWHSGTTGRNGEVVAWRGRTLSTDPEIFYTPAWGEWHWSGKFSWTQQQWDGGEAEPLFNVRQSVRFIADFGRLECTAEAEHIHSELSGSRPEDLLLLDASLCCRGKKWRTELQLRNLLDRRTTRTAWLHPNGITTLHYALRGRELLLQVQCTF